MVVSQSQVSRGQLGGAELMAKNYVFDKQGVRAIAALLRSSKGRELTGGGGRRFRGLSSFLARLTNAGPDSEADYTDPRYWARELMVTNSDGDETSELTFAYPPAGSGRWITATNIHEIIADTHGLSVNNDQIVVVYVIHDRDGLARYYFESPAIVVD